MFGKLLEKRRLRKVMVDIENTMLATFENLKNSARSSISPAREFEMGGNLAALIGGLRNAYPNIPIEENSIAMALIEANSPYNMTDSIALSDAISKLVLECPDSRGEKIDTTFFMIAPESARLAKGI